MLEDPNAYLFRAGRDVGIHFTTKRNMYPTLRAHALMEYVKEQDNDKANRLMEEMYKSYFELGENINDEDHLVELATKVGVSKNEALRATQDENLKRVVAEKDTQSKRSMRISGVPFYIMERQGDIPIGFSGAQPVDIIVEQLCEAADL